MEYKSYTELSVRYQLCLLLKKLGLQNETLQNIDKHQIFIKLIEVKDLISELREVLTTQSEVE